MFVEESEGRSYFDNADTATCYKIRVHSFQEESICKRTSLPGDCWFIRNTRPASSGVSEGQTEATTELSTQLSGLDPEVLTKGVE